VTISAKLLFYLSIILVFRRNWDSKSGDYKLCICGDILRGIAKPTDCQVFATACTPTKPLGSCMVSSEGACAAYYKYGTSFLK